MPRRKRRGGWGARNTSAGATAPAEARRLTSDLQGYQKSLMSQRESLDRQIAAVAEAIQAMGAAPAAAAAPAGRRAGMGGMRGAGGMRAGGGAVRRGPGRPRGSRSGARAGSLKSYIADVLSKAGGPLSVKEITQGVLRSGYKSKSKTLGNQVSAAIAGMSLSKVGRGLYQV